MIISMYNSKTSKVLEVSAAYAQKDSGKYFSMYLYELEDVPRVICFLQLNEHEYTCRRLVLTVKEDTLSNIIITMK
jgi:hypothetical protein